MNHFRKNLGGVKWKEENRYREEYNKKEDWEELKDEEIGE